MNLEDNFCPNCGSKVAQNSFQQDVPQSRHFAKKRFLYVLPLSVSALFVFGLGGFLAVSTFGRQPQHSILTSVVKKSVTTSTSSPGWPHGALAIAKGASLQSGPAVPTGPTNNPYGPSRGIPPRNYIQKIICTTDGNKPSPISTSAPGFWLFTDLGWILSDYVDTSTLRGELGPACGGTVSKPIPTQAFSSFTAGPFPIIGISDVAPVFARPSLQSKHVKSLKNGTFVRLVCSISTGIKVEAPVRISSQGSNDQWDRISQPIFGWIPDSWVVSFSNGSVATKC